tara:strand:- start:2554 stop:4947 length:2394 start_codon:yes stop_codon:yes gene_type:complete
MTTQYTTILKLALPVQGELSGTWGNVVNDNITQMVEQAIAGKATINSWTGNAHTLTTADGTTSEARCAILDLTDTGTSLSGAGSVICPAQTKVYIVENNTAQIVTVKTASGTGIAVPVNKTMVVYCDGTNVVEGITHTNSLSLGTSTTAASSILDEDNMASNSATALATQQSIKAYVDSQVATADTLTEVLGNGNTTSGTDIVASTDDKVQFRDSAIYINSSTDGQLDIVADTEVQIAATTVDINGAVALNGAMTGGTNITISGELDAATLDISGNADIDGTTNLDAVDIDGAVQIDATVTVGVDDTGYDVKFFGDTASAYMLWDASADDLILGGAAGLTVGGDVDVDGTIEFDALSGTGSVTVTDIKDEDSMTSNSATALATQQSIKAYVDSGGVSNSLKNTLVAGNITDGYDIVASTDDKVQFRDAAIYINSSTDGQLDIVADTEIQIAATTIDINGAVALDGAITGGTNITISGELDAATLDISGNADIDGTTNLDAVDIDGAVQIDATVTVGVDDTGYDVKFFGDTASAYMLWDASADDLILGGAAGLDVDGTTNLDAVDIDGAVQIDATVTVGVDDTGYDVKFFGDTASAYMLWDASADDLILGGAAGLEVATKGTFGGASNGVEVSQGAIALKNGGSVSKIDFYCEQSNAHYTRLQSAPHASYSGNITLTLPASDGDSGQFLQTNGSGVMSWAAAGGAYNDWNVISSGSSHTATSKDQLVILSASAFTVTLPAGSVNDSVTIHNAGAGTVTVASNGSEKIESSTDNGTLFTDDTTQLVYVSSTIGWKEMNV